MSRLLDADSTKDIGGIMEKEEKEYYSALAEYGSDECVHVLADQWGTSTLNVKKIIEEIENSWL